MTLSCRNRWTNNIDTGDAPDFLVRHEAFVPDCIAGVETGSVAREWLSTCEQTEAR